MFFSLATAITKRDSNINFNNASEQPERLLEEYIVDNHWVTTFDRIVSRKKNAFNDQSYIPLYINVKYLNHSSSVTLSMRVGTGFTSNKEPIEEHTYSILTERLTIINP